MDYARASRLPSGWTKITASRDYYLLPGSGRSNPSFGSRPERDTTLDTYRFDTLDAYGSGTKHVQLQVAA